MVDSRRLAGFGRYWTTWTIIIFIFLSIQYAGAQENIIEYNDKGIFILDDNITYHINIEGKYVLCYFHSQFLDLKLRAGYIENNSLKWYNLFMSSSIGLTCMDIKIPKGGLYLEGNTLVAICDYQMYHSKIYEIFKKGKYIIKLNNYLTSHPKTKIHILSDKKIIKNIKIYILNYSYEKVKKGPKYMIKTYNFDLKNTDYFEKILFINRTETILFIELELSGNGRLYLELSSMKNTQSSIIENIVYIIIFVAVLIILFVKKY